MEIYIKYCQIIVRCYLNNQALSSSLCFYLFILMFFNDFFEKKTQIESAKTSVIFRDQTGTQRTRRGRSIFCDFCFLAFFT